MPFIFFLIIAVFMVGTYNIGCALVKWWKG